MVCGAEVGVVFAFSSLFFHGTIFQNKEFPSNKGKNINSYEHIFFVQFDYQTAPKFN
jgi:hypothetical protein